MKVLGMSTLLWQVGCEEEKYEEIHRTMANNHSSQASAGSSNRLLDQGNSDQLGLDRLTLLESMEMLMVLLGTGK